MNYYGQIKKMDIQPVILFLSGIPKDSNSEFKYIGLLERILKLNYDY